MLFLEEGLVVMLIESILLHLFMSQDISMPLAKKFVIVLDIEAFLS